MKPSNILFIKLAAVISTALIAVFIFYLFTPKNLLFHIKPDSIIITETGWDTTIDQSISWNLLYIAVLIFAILLFCVYKASLRFFTYLWVKVFSLQLK